MSSANIETGRLKIVCENYILRKQKQTEEALEELILNEFENSVEPTTRWDVITRLESGSRFSTWVLLRSAEERWPVLEVKALLKLAIESDDGFVSVDAEMVNLLF